MPRDSDLAAIAEEAYAAPPSFHAGDVHAFYTLRAGIPVLAVRGSTRDPRDWLRDFAALPVYSEKLRGFAHEGFLCGASDLLPSLPRDILAGAVLTGHSMGGAIAILLAALLCAEGKMPRAVVTFGAPRALSWRIRHLVRAIPMRLYRCGDDPVPDLPWLPGVYLHPRPLIAIGSPSLDPIADHAIAQYRAALGANEEKPA